MTTAYKIEDATSPLWLGGLGRGFSDLRDVDPNGEGIDSATMLERAGLNWQVEQRELQVIDGPAVATHVANVRSDTGGIVGVVGRGYTPLQNDEGFAFTDGIVQSGSGGWMTARHLNGGSTVVALMKLNRDIKIGGLDSEGILPLLAFRNGHDGGTALSMRMMPLRLACLNGMLLPVKGSVREWKARHTASISRRGDEARKALDVAWTYYDELEQLGNRLVAERVTERQFTSFLDRLIPLPVKDDETKGGRAATNREAAVAAIRGYWNGENLANVHGTAWGALQAVGEYADWDRPVRTTERTSGDENRFVRVGAVSPIKDRALELLTA